MFSYQIVVADTSKYTELQNIVIKPTSRSFVIADSVYGFRCDLGGQLTLPWKPTSNIVAVCSHIRDSSICITFQHFLYIIDLYMWKELSHKNTPQFNVLSQAK